MISSRLAAFGHVGGRHDHAHLDARARRELAAVVRGLRWGSPPRQEPALLYRGRAGCLHARPPPQKAKTARQRPPTPPTHHAPDPPSLGAKQPGAVSPPPRRGNGSRMKQVDPP